MSPMFTPIEEFGKYSVQYKCSNLLTYTTKILSIDNLELYEFLKVTAIVHRQRIKSKFINQINNNIGFCKIRNKLQPFSGIHVPNLAEMSFFFDTSIPLGDVYETTL